MESNYCTPSKQYPVFTATCEDFGTIEESIYKMWNIKKEGVINQVGTTFALNYVDAINNLHEWIKENADYVKRLKNINFVINAIDGSLNKWGEVVETKVYSINSSKAKKYLL